MPVVIPVAVLLTLISAFFSAAATAVFSVGGSRLRTLVEEGFKGAEELSDLRSRTGFLQGILLLLGTLCNLSVMGLVTGWASLRWELQGFWIALPVSALIIILFGEILPRSLAARRSIRRMPTRSRRSTCLCGGLTWRPTARSRNPRRSPG